MKKLSLLFILSISTIPSSTSLDSDLAYKTSSLITEHWFGKSCFNQQLPSELIYEISKFTTFPYCLPQPVIKLVLSSKKGNRLINVVQYQNNTYVILSSICNQRTNHIQIASIKDLASRNQFIIPQKCTCNIIFSATCPNFIQKNRAHLDIASLERFSKSVKHQNFAIKQNHKCAPNMSYDPGTSHFIIINHKKGELYIVHQYNKIRQTLSYAHKINTSYGIWCNKILLHPNNKSIFLILWEHSGYNNAILQFKYNLKHNKYHDQPIFLHALSFYICEDRYSLLNNLDCTVVLCPKQNTLYCYCIEDRNGQHINTITNTIPAKRKLEHYKEYICVMDLKNTKHMKKISIDNNANHTFCRFVSGGTGVIGLIFLSNNHKSKTLGHFATLNTNAIQKNINCIDTSNMIKVDLLQNKNTLSSLYYSLALENNTQLSLDNKRLIHVYKDKNGHRMVHFDTTTGKKINSWQLTNQKTSKFNGNSTGSASLISTSLGFVTLTTNFFVRSN